MNGSVFIQGIERLVNTFPSIKPESKSVDFWFEELKDLTDPQFTEALNHICRNVKDIFQGTNIAALIREHSPKKRQDDSAERETARFLEGVEGIQGIVEKINPGKAWDVKEYQANIVFDPDSKPKESCYCGGQVDYHWVETEWLFRKWGQKKPFWLRVGCMKCNEQKRLQKKRQSVEVYTEEELVNPLTNGASRKVIPFSSIYDKE